MLDQANLDDIPPVKLPYVDHQVPFRNIARYNLLFVEYNRPQAPRATRGVAGDHSSPHPPPLLHPRFQELIPLRHAHLLLCHVFLERENEREGDGEGEGRECLYIKRGKEPRFWSIECLTYECS